MKTYTLTRCGDVINHENCGLEGDTVISYNVKITVSHLKLDNNGFMVDHDDIDEFITHEMTNAISCEQCINKALDFLVDYFQFPSIKSRMKLISIEMQAGLKNGLAHFSCIYNHK